MEPTREDLIKRLRKNMDDLESTLLDLEALDVFVSFGHTRGNLGQYSDNKSDRVYLTTVSLIQNLYNWKDKDEDGRTT